MSKFTPREAQIHRIDRFLAEPTKAGLLADEPGVGKTLVAVEVALRFERTLTIGVKDTYQQFADLFEAQSEGAAVLRRVDSTKAGKAAMADMLAGVDGHYFAGSQFLTRQDYEYRTVRDSLGGPVWKTDKMTGLVITKERGENEIGPAEIPQPETFSFHLKTYRKMKPFDALIFDEVHVIQNRRSAGFKTIKTIRTDYKLAMSGTPYGNKFPGIWAITRWLWPELIDASFERWKHVWCLTEDVYLKGRKTTENVIGERYPGEFVKTLPFYIRAEAEPVPAPIEVMVDLTPIQASQYAALEEDLIVWIGENPLVVDLPPILRQRLRTLALGELSVTPEGQPFFANDCKSSKLGALGGILRGYWGGEKAIIGMESKTFAYVTYARMVAAGESVAIWTGDTTSKGRDEIKRAFLAGEVQYIICTIRSMSTGLDGFQTVCSKLAWMNELDGDESGNEQFVRRLFRPGRVGNFEHIKLIARGTKDEDVYGANLALALKNRSTLRLAA